MGRVLVVDDEEDVRILIRTNLLVKGHEVAEAQTGEEALQEISDSPPDLVVLDVMMPGMDGFEVLDALRSAPSTESLPVLMLTAKSAEEDRVKGLVKGAHDYLAKPFFMTELLLRIDRILNTKATADSLRQISMVDPVTGVYNRRYFELRLEQLCEKSDAEKTDLVAYVIDIQGMHDIARRKGWRRVDKVLGRAGSWLKGAVAEGEEAFWLGAGFVVLSTSAESAAAARSRLDDLKRGIADPLNSDRKEVQLIPYFGYSFRSRQESADDFFNAISQAPYKSGAVVSPGEEERRSSERSIEQAFGGKLTGLAPVEPDREDRAKAKKARAERRKKISGGILNRELREAARLTKSDESSSEESVAPSSTDTPEEAVQQAAVALGSPAELKKHLESECAAASSEEFDVAVFTVEIEGIDEAVAMVGKEAVDDALGPITLKVAAMEHEAVFWTGRQLVSVKRSVGVPAARIRVKELTSAYSDELQKHKSRMRLSASGGYAYYDFNESVDELLDKAAHSPFRGGLPITPLEARSRSHSVETSTEEHTDTQPIPEDLELGGNEVAGEEAASSG